MDRRGTPPRIAIVREMIRLLVAQRFKSTTLRAYHQLVKTEYESLSTAMIRLTRNIIGNTTINEQNAKIRSLFERGFNT